MPMMSTLLVVISLLLSFSTAAPVIVGGDSWGVQGWKVLEEVLQGHNNTKHLTVVSYARTGTTTSDWIKPTTKLVDDINKNADAKYLWLTIGGNDAADYLPRCTAKKPYPDTSCMEEIIDIITNQTMMMLDPVFKQHPDLEVVQFGYDILNFEKGICSLKGRELMHGCDDTALCINTQFIKLQTQYIKRLQEKYGKRYHGINLLGTLQFYGGVPNVTVGHPDLNQWSPRKLIEDNCIHPKKPKGFHDVFEEMYKAYWVHV